jgi:hypothetical protein
MNRFDKQQTGETGVIYETGTTALTGLDVFKITTLTVTTFAVLTNTLADASSDAITGIAIPAGVDLYGKFTNITLTSGAVALYKSDKL